MNRALLLLPLAALATGCYVAPPCDPVANVYWTFNVPGATNLSCFEAGVDTVSIFVDGNHIDTVSCVGPGGVEGIQLVGFEHGTHLLQLDVYSGGTAGTRRYELDQNIAFNGCTSNYDAPAVGLPGDLDLTYLFDPPVTSCLQNSYAWYQLRDASNTDYDMPPMATNFACGSQPIGPLNLPAGLYTLSKFEVGQLGGNSWTPDYNACAGRTFVHAGPETRSTTLTPAPLVSGVPQSCWR